MKTQEEYALEIDEIVRRDVESCQGINKHNRRILEPFEENDFWNPFLGVEKTSSKICRLRIFQI